MRRLIAVAVLVAAQLGCDASWTETIHLDERLERDGSAAWELVVEVGADTVEAVVRDGGELTLTTTVEARYPYLLGPRGVVGAALAVPEAPPVALAGDAPHRRVDLGTLRLTDLIATSCPDAVQCAQPNDTGGDTAQVCASQRCELTADLFVQRGDEPGRLRTWLTVEAALDPVLEFDRPELSLYAIPR